MNTVAQTGVAPKRWMVWTGRVISALIVLVMVPGIVMNLTHNPQALEGMKKFGYQESAMLTVAVLAAVAMALYAIPRTAVLGAIVMTGYFGGAIATHLRIADPGWPLPLTCGILTWLGLYLRDERLRALLPLMQGR